MTKQPDRKKTKVEFIVSGETAADRARELRKLFDQWQKTGSTHLENSGTGLTIRVIITEPARETSVAHCISYACGELEEGIVEAGGSIWDGTHVQITRTIGPLR